jgi:GNAT superfamily N-acetyltransferase
MPTDELQRELGPGPKVVPIYRQHRFDRVACELPVEPVVTLLNAAPRVWTGPVLALRGCPNPDPAYQLCSLQVEDLPQADQLAPALAPLITQLLEALDRGGLEANPLGRVQIVRIPSGGVFGRGLEEGRYAEHYECFVVALQASPGARLFIDDSDLQPRPGSAWWINRKRPARVVNHGDEDLLLLLVDVYAPAYTAARGVYIQREYAWEWWREAEPLFRAHWAESAAYPDIPLDIDYEAYFELEKAGLLRCFTVRSDGALVGYCIVLVQRARRYRTVLQGVGEDLYLAPAHRSSHLAEALLATVELELTKEGVRLFFPGATEHGRAGRFFEGQGYHLVGHVYGKRLG